MSGVKQGLILKSVSTGKRCRVISLYRKSVALCTMDTTKVEVNEFSIELVNSMVRSGDFTVEEDMPYIFDVDDLSPPVRDAFLKKRAVIMDIEEEYGPDFLRLCGKKHKPELEEILKKHDMDPVTFWRTILKYLQEGRRECALLDGRVRNTNKGKSYEYAKKTGRPPELVPESGIMRDERTIAILEDMTDEYLKRRNASYKDIYSLMLDRYYMRVETVDGEEKIVYAPIDERPSRPQMEYFIRTHSGAKQRRIKKTSEREFENDERLLLGDVKTDARHPGDIIELDAMETDVYLVSAVNRKDVIGRATLYLAVDDYSGVIPAVSVGLEVNSNQGITNLFMNLCDDKQEFCSWYGIGFDNPDMWPSCFIPARIRLDRGAEMKSNLVETICKKLGINRQLVPGAKGSAKGAIESLFHAMNSQIGVHLENNGLIEKRYDSPHMATAVLTIEEFARMVVSFVLAHNQRHGCERTKEQIEAGVGDTPIDIWNYGIEKYGPPEPIRDPEHYLYNLMPAKNATLSRDGLCLHGLYYIPNDDPELVNGIYAASGKRVKVKVHYDPRHIGSIYYLRDGRIVNAPLNPKKHVNEGLENLTLDQWDYYRKEISKKKRKGQDENELLDAYIFLVYGSIVEAARNASPDGPNKTNDIRPSRAVERARLAASDTIENRLAKARAVLAEGCGDADGNGETPEEAAGKMRDVSGNINDADTANDVLDEEAEHYESVINEKLLEDEES